MKYAGRADNVPVSHFDIAARLLGANSPVNVAPYKISETAGGIRTFVWVMDDVEPETKLGMRGFALGSCLSKWVGIGIVVRYDAHRKLRPVAYDAPGFVQWVDAGAGKCDAEFELHAMPRPMTCAYPPCNKADDSAKPRFQRCARCMKAFYCSKACQVAHWHAGHKIGGCAP
jgi:hypothetical protein